MAVPSGPAISAGQVGVGDEHDVRSASARVCCVSRSRRPCRKAPVTNELLAYWWSPRRAARVLASELRAHGPAWAHLLRPVGRSFTNFGDELTRLVLSETFGRPVRWAPLGREDVTAIGSIVESYVEHGGRGLVWGSGLSRPTITPARAAPVAGRFLAVRGPLTRDSLGLDPSLQLGDPGLVVRSLASRPRPRSGTILIPHFTVYGTRTGRRKISALAAAGHRVMPPTLAPAEMIAEIAGAESVISSGMHGVILSHGLGTPATLVSFADRVPATPDFKYHDYHESVGLPPRMRSWTTFLERTATSIRAVDLARHELSEIDSRIDTLVNGLLEAGRPLRHT